MMDVLVVGGHGKIGLRLLRLAAERGDTARGLIRNPEQAGDLEAVGAEAVVCDVEAEDDISGAVGEADAIVFAAGAGPGSGPARKQTVDLGGAVKSVAAAKKNGVGRFLIVSSIGADDPPEGDEGMAPYLRAKAAADAAVASSGLDFTIVRPGSLSDEPGTGKIVAAAKLDRSGPHRSISRDDVAATLLAAIDEPATVGKTFELLSGEDEIAAALKKL
jgi:uncharacterized protein YbjT (DUF2867 family)